MSLEFRTKYIYRTNGDILEGGTAHSIVQPEAESRDSLERDVLHRVKRTLVPKDSASLYAVSQVNKKIFVSNTEKDDWAATVETFDKDSAATIDYLITEFRGRGSEAMLAPINLVANDPDQYITPELAMRLLSLDAKVLGRHAINNTLLIPYLQSAYGDYGDTDPFDDLLA